MEIAVFLLLVCAATFSVQEKCHDLLGNCRQMSHLCREPKSAKQMRTLCGKTCRYCRVQGEVEVPQVVPQQVVVQTKAVPQQMQFTNEIFLLYLKNDVKFLKEEITDVKYRLREVSSRQKKHWEQIRNSKGGLPRPGSPKSDPGSPKPGPGSPKSGPGSPRAGPGSPGPPNPELSQPTIVENEDITNEMKELKEQTRRLTSRIQDENDRFSSLKLNFTDKLSNTNDEFSEKVKSVSNEILSLSGDLKKYAEQIESLSDIEDDLEDFKKDSRSMTQQLEKSTSTSINELKNFTRNFTRLFLKSQEQLFEAIDKERMKSTALEIKLNNMTSAFQKEQQKRIDLQQVVKTKLGDKEDDRDDKVDGDDSEEEKKIQFLMGRLVNVTGNVHAQNTRSHMLSTLIEELQNKMSNVTAEQVQTRRYLAYQYQFLFKHIRGLVAKLNRVEQFSKEVMNKTLNKVKTSTVVDAGGVSKLSQMVQQIMSQLSALKKLKSDQGKKSTEETDEKASNQNSEIITKMSVGLEDLKMKMADEEARLTRLDAEIGKVANNSAKGIAEIKESIESMALLRNNESVSVQEISNKYQKGIMSLLGPQLSNTTRFFKPRFDWENSKLSIYGFIAINHEGEWGTICDDNFDDREAKVLCRMAGYKGGIYDGGKYKISDGKIFGKSRTEYKIWIDELRCQGDESTIEDCRAGSDGWGVHDCDHGEDIGIKCYIS